MSLDERIAARAAARAAALTAALGDIADSPQALSRAVDVIADALRAGNCVLVAGNGGSAAEAQHLAGELVGRLTAARDRAPLAGMALTADTGVLTALANDYGFEQIFARQVEAIGRPGDVLVVLSTSGSSRNCVLAVEEAHRRGLRSVGLVGGRPSELRESCDVAVVVSADDVATIQETHLVLIHLLVELVEDQLLGG